MYLSTEPEQAEFLAESIRHDLWGDAKFPVDPVTICRRLDVAVKQVKLPNPLLGVFAKNANDKSTIIVNSVDSDNLKRIACAQGLGYHILKVEKLNNAKHSENFTIRYFRNQALAVPEGEEDDHEFARNFALDLLIPPDKLASLFYERTRIQLSLFFGVSHSDIEAQILALGLQTRKSKHKLQQQQQKSS